MADTGKLSAKQLELVTALAAGATVAEAIKRCHIAERTAYRWVKLPEVQAALEEAKQKAFNEALSLLRSGTKAAIATLAASMKADSEGVRLRAAAIWLTQAIEVYKMSEIQASFDELERLLKANGLAR